MARSRSVSRMLLLLLTVLALTVPIAVWPLAARPAAAAVCPCTIWSNSATPAVASVNDNSAVELGVRFRSDTAGYITGLRFYQGGQNTGTHTGHLWTNAGTLLSTVTFSGETASGWQQVTLPAPVAVSANTTYVASYHTDVGFYSANNGAFATSGVDNSPLHALADGVDGPNGVYAYGGSQFPVNTYRSTNYWVDVVFNQTAADTVPPIVTSQSPAPNATGVSTGASVTATFSEPVQPSTISFTLTGPGGAVPAAVTYDGPSQTVTLKPGAALSASTSYTATVSGAQDLAGNAMTGPVTWSFTTGGPPPPPPDQGPGGPILAVTSGADPFTKYNAEVLRAEGFNEFATADISTVTPATLNNYDVVILGQMSLTAAQVSMLTTWVNAGGSLIALRPDKQLAGLLGLTAGTGTLSDAYLQVNTSSGPGLGITNQTIQFHGPADRYTTSGATTVATLYSTATKSTANPAVTLRNVGTSGGQAAAFTYDLDRSIVFTRQGNLVWAGQEQDGFPPIRSDDLYFGGSRPDYVDLSKVAIPQADEQQRLLTNLIETMNLHRKPLPRFWYFPRDAKAVVLSTGDDHGNGGTAGRFDQYNANSPAGCAVDNWQCLRASSYIYPHTPLTNAQATTYTGQGFEVGLHVNTDCADWTSSSLASFYSSQLGAWQQKYAAVPSPSTNRTHCIVWSNWATQPQMENTNGMRLDTNYYYWPPSWVNDQPGFFTGSGMPMRFAQTDGTMVDTYQATTQLTDESGQSYPYTPDTLLDNALGPLGYYGVFTANMHTDQAQTPEDDELITSVQAHGVPIISGQQLLQWVNGRNGSSFGSVSWTGNTLSFTVAVGTGANGLTGMVPMRAANGTLTELTQNGSRITYTTEMIKGVQYAVFSAGGGSYSATYGPTAAPAVLLSSTSATQPAVTAATPPVITNVRVEALPDQSASVLWQTDQNANAEVEFGTTPSALTSHGRGSGLAKAHSVMLTHLRPKQSYSFRVLSRNPAGQLTPSPVFQFIQPKYGVADSRAAQFRTGIGAGTSVATGADGELQLARNGQGWNTSGTFVSRLLDVQQMVSWEQALWHADVPTGTSLRVSVRTGSISPPDASWTPWVPVLASGSSLTRLVQDSRYLQYRVDLTGNGAATPTLSSIGFTSSGDAPTFPMEGGGGFNR